MGDDFETRISSPDSFEMRLLERECRKLIDKGVVTHFIASPAENFALEFIGEYLGSEKVEIFSLLVYLHNLSLTNLEIFRDNGYLEVILQNKVMHYDFTQYTEDTESFLGSMYTLKLLDPDFNNYLLEEYGLSLSEGTNLIMSFAFQSFIDHFNQEKNNQLYFPYTNKKVARKKAIQLGRSTLVEALKESVYLVGFTDGGLITTSTRDDLERVRKEEGISFREVYSL